MEPTTENMEKMGKAVAGLKERLDDIETKSTTRQAELKEECKGFVKEQMEAAKEIGRVQKTSQMANDYTGESKALIDRVLHDGAPHARSLKGESLTGSERWVHELQGLGDDVLTICAAKGAATRLTEETAKDMVCFDGDKPSAAGQKLWAQFVKVRGMATDVEFAAWVPTLFSPRMFDRYVLSLELAGIFEQVIMPHSPFVYPVQWNRRTLVNSYWGEATGSTGFPAWTPGAGVMAQAQDSTALNFTLTAKKCTDARMVSDEATVESIIAVLPAMQNDIADFHAWAVEQVLLNGDSRGASHMDTDIGANGTIDIRGQVDGLRRLCLAGSCATDRNTNSWYLSTLRGSRKSMGVYGIRPKDTVWVFSPTGYINALSITDGTTANTPVFLTMEKAGAAATAITGALGILDGSAVLCSEASRDDLYTAGVYNASGGYCTTLLVNRTCFILGERSGIETKYFDMPLHGATGLVSNHRFAFMPKKTMSTTNSFAWLGYKIAI